MLQDELLKENIGSTMGWCDAAQHVEWSFHPEQCILKSFFPLIPQHTVSISNYQFIVAFNVVNSLKKTI